MKLEQRLGRGIRRALSLASLLMLVMLPAFGVEPDPHVKKLLDDGNLKYNVVEESGNFQLTFEVEDSERTHLVTIRSAVQTYMDYSVRQVYAMAYKAPDEVGKIPTPIMRALLVANGTVKIGAWEISDDGSAAFFTVKMPAESNFDELLSVIDAVIETADEMELKLTNEDDY